MVAQVPSSNPCVTAEHLQDGATVILCKCHWAKLESSLRDTKKGTVGTQVTAVYTDCFSLWSTHHGVRTVTANMQGTVCQVKSTETASSLWNKRGWVEISQLRSHHSPHTTQHTTPVHSTSEPQIHVQNGSRTRCDEGKTYDSCHRRPSWSGVLMDHPGAKIPSTCKNNDCGLGSSVLCQRQQAFQNDFCHLVLNHQGGERKHVYNHPIRPTGLVTYCPPFSILDKNDDNFPI